MLAEGCAYDADEVRSSNIQGPTAHGGSWGARVYDAAQLWVRSDPYAALRPLADQGVAFAATAISARRICPSRLQRTIEFGATWIHGGSWDHVQGPSDADAVYAICN